MTTTDNGKRLNRNNHRTSILKKGTAKHVKESTMNTKSRNNETDQNNKKQKQSTSKQTKIIEN